MLKYITSDQILAGARLCQKWQNAEAELWYIPSMHINE